MNFQQAIQKAQDSLRNRGMEVVTKTIQGKPSPTTMWEAMNVTIQCSMADNITGAQILIQPNLPWADEHFEERISGQPLNPPPSHKRWPYNSKNPEDKIFSHTYPERFWPKFAGEDGPRTPSGIGKPNHGIRFNYGDLNDVIYTLKKDIHSRQAFLPVWFPEDTMAATMGERVPCTIGYQFLVRMGYIHVIYTIRSCDFFRHMRDDIYMAWRLTMHVKKMISQDGYMGVGSFTMHIGSLHCFLPEKVKL